MEQNKYRKQIQHGYIDPSEDAWKKLDQKLNTYDRGKKYSNRNFLKYAVSFIFLVSLGFFFMPKENKNPNRIESKPQIEQKLPESSEIQTETNPNTIATIQGETKSKLKKDGHQSNVSIKQDIIETIDSHEEITFDPDENSDLAIHDHPNEVRLQLPINKSDQNLNQDDEVDVLLKKANLILEKNRKNFNSNKQLAMDLLGEVENDLKHDKRRKLFEKIIITIKSPSQIEIADRNEK